MTFPGAGRAVLIGGSLGGGTGRTTDWSTYDGTNDTAWQQWVDDSSTALGTTYQSIKGFKNTALASSGSVFLGIDNNGTQTVAKFVPDTDDATAGHFTLGSFHDLGTDRVQLIHNGFNPVLTSAVDSGTIVVFNQSLADSGKVSGLAGITGSDWDATCVSTTTSHGGGSGPPYDYTTGHWHSAADLIVWTRSGGTGNRTGFSWALWLKGTYTNQGTNGSGRDGLNELLTTPSQSPYYAQSGNDGSHNYGDLLDNDGFDDHHNHIHWMRNHLEEDSGWPSWEQDYIGAKRQTERFFLSQKYYESSGVHHAATETTNAFKMMLMNHYAYQGSGGWGGDGASTTLHNENSYRSNSDVKYFKVTGRSTNNINNDNHASMVKGKSMIQVYNDESGSLGGNIYVTAMTDTTETASSEYNPTAHDGGGVAEMFRFDEVTANNTHSTNAKIISTTNSSDSTNTSFDPEALCLGDLHGNYFGVAWRQGTTAYVSVFEIQEQTSDMPVLTRVADSINLGTVPNAGRMALSKLGNGVAVLTCGNYYRIIKTDTI
jgi:hypothetical protein